MAGFCRIQVRTTMVKRSTKKRGRAATTNKTSDLCSSPGCQVEGHHNYKEAESRKMSYNTDNLTDFTLPRVKCQWKKGSQTPKKGKETKQKPVTKSVVAYIKTKIKVPPQE